MGASLYGDKLLVHVRENVPFVRQRVHRLLCVVCCVAENSKNCDSLSPDSEKKVLDC